jgi:phosphatidylinositol glycan class B
MGLGQPSMLPSNVTNFSSQKSQQSWWPYIHAVAAIGLFLRLGVALGSDQINHPDEIFQYLEQAHRMVFGYGYIPWEYRFGLRSLIIPIALSIPLRLLQALQLDRPDVYIPLIKSLLCLISLSLIYGLYSLGRQTISESVGRMAAIIASFWHELVVFAHKPTPECLATYLLVGALVCLAHRPQLHRPQWLMAVGLGIMGAGTVALRLQYAPAVLVLGMAMVILWRSRPAQMALVIATFGLTLVGVGYVDYLTWGIWFGSYYHNYLYNQTYGISSLFGRVFFLYYLGTLILFSAGVFPVGIVLAVKKRVPFWGLWISLLASILVVHSWIPNKQYRFVFAAVPICILLTAIAYVAIQTADRSAPHRPRRLAYFFVAYSCLGILITTVLLSKNPVLQGYLFLSRQPQVAAVLDLKSEWYETGGYYYLHQAAPIYFEKDLAAVAPAAYGEYVSDILCPHDQAVIPGFTTAKTIRNIDIRRNSAPPAQYRQLPGDPYQPQQGGVDGVLPQPVFDPPIQLFPRAEG